MKATIKDVAQLSQVSATTVSMILNNKPIRATAETRERVLAAAKKLGYQPNPVAVALVTKKSRTIGLILPNIGNYFFSELSKLCLLYTSKAVAVCSHFFGSLFRGLPYLDFSIDNILLDLFHLVADLLRNSIHIIFMIG